MLMKLKSKTIEEGEKNKFLDALYTCAGGLRSQKEIKSFLRDFLTESEKIMIGRRLLIAQRLLARHSYDRIVREMNVGLDTVYKINRWLNHGFMGHNKIFRELKRATKFKKKPNLGFKDYHPSGPFADLKRRYKSYYWLSNLLEEINK